MKRSMALLLAVAASMTASCVPLVATAPPPSGPPPGYYQSPPPSYPASAPPQTAAAPTPGEDPHWIRSDEYFLHSPLVQGWAWVYLAKMKQPASPKTKGKAQFMYVQDGSEEWSDTYHLTRPASPADLTEQNLLLCYMQNSRSNINHAPATKEDARGGGPRWIIGRVTDVSEVGQGHVILASGRKCGVDTLRAIVP